MMKHSTLYEQTVFNLIDMLEKLASFSITPLQTKLLLESLRQDSQDHQHLVSCNINVCIF